MQKNQSAPGRGVFCALVDADAGERERCAVSAGEGDGGGGGSVAVCGVVGVP